MESRLIGYYGEDAAKLPADQFAARHGPAFLLYANAAGPLASVIPGGSTLMRTPDGGGQAPPVGKSALYNVYPLEVAPGDECVVGSDPDTAQVVVNDDSVSRRHASVRRHAGGFALKDLGSTLGTQLNGKTLGTEDEPLHPGASVTLGSVELVFVDAAAFQLLAQRVLA